MRRFNIFRNTDWFLFLLVLVLIGIGLVAVYSATHAAGLEKNIYFTKQVAFSVFGILVMFLVSLIPLRVIKRYAYHIYGLAIVSLLLVTAFGIQGQGAERWLDFGFVRLQPSEFAKLATILAAAKYISTPKVNINRFKNFIIIAALILLPMILVARQPDLGTALVFAVLLIPIVFWAGLDWFFGLILIAPAISAALAFHNIAFAAWIFIIVILLFLSRRSVWVSLAVLALHITVGLTTPVMWQQLRPYQQQRIISFINPEADPRGSGYQVIQSRVAIGSGGAWGKGFMQGSQTQLKFLPAQHTDFIFSVIGEEWGFFGSSFVLGIYLILLLYLLNLATLVRSVFSSIALIGIVAILIFHVVINIGMTIGFAPVTGLPLPFISYGGSFLMVILLMMGLALNFSANRFNI